MAARVRSSQRRFQVPASTAAARTRRPTLQGEARENKVSDLAAAPTLQTYKRYAQEWPD
jgi:hypothetical protein